MLELGFKSDKGIRRGNNEDACFVIPSSDVYIVADGVGGASSGEIASRTAVSRIADYVDKHPLNGLKDEEAVIAYFLECLKGVNAEIYESAQKFKENAGMATTVVIAYVPGDVAYVVNVGDSRGYVCRNGEMTQITEDHTYVNTLVKRGIITPEEAKNHKEKNKITRALGGEATIEPDFFKIEIKQGDVILLCSDGLYGEVDDASMAKVLSDKGSSMSAACAKLVTIANRHGGRDNITVVALRV
jgi:protein phosphatase